MTYIIAEPCIDIKDLSCVDVCPVDCIHEFERILIIDPEECIDCGACEPECPVEVAETYPDVPILGFTNHTDTSGLRAANEAGFDQVVVKSALVERAKDLVEGLIASVD